MHPQCDICRDCDKDISALQQNQSLISVCFNILFPLLNTEVLLFVENTPNVYV